MSIDQRPVEILPGEESSAAADADHQPAAPSASIRVGGVRARLGRRSLTARLVTGVVLLVIILVGAIGGGTYLALRSFLANRLDQQLQSTVNQGAGRIFNGAPTNGPSATEVYAIALAPDTGAVLDSPPPSAMSVEPIRLSSAEAKQLASRSSDQPLTIMTSDGQQLRAVVLDGTYRNGTSESPAKIILALSTHEEHETLGRLIFLETLIGGAAVLLALVATYGGVRLSLRRLRDVTSTAQEVAAELSPTGSGLERRVPVAERAPRSASLHSRSTRCLRRSRRSSRRASRANNACASSSPTPRTSCGRR